MSNLWRNIHTYAINWPGW